MIDREDALYCGCFGSLGFYVWLPGPMKIPDHARERRLAAKLDWPRWQPRSEVEGEAKVTQLVGWTILSFADRSVDSRPMSHSTFALRGELDFAGAVDAASEAFPQVFERFTFKITEAGRTQPELARRKILEAFGVTEDDLVEIEAATGFDAARAAAELEEKAFIAQMQAHAAATSERLSRRFAGDVTWSFEPVIGLEETSAVNPRCQPRRSGSTEPPAVDVSSSPDSADAWRCRCGFPAEECIRCEPPKPSEITP